LGTGFCIFGHANVATKSAATKRKITLQYFRHTPRDAR